MTMNLNLHTNYDLYDNLKHMIQIEATITLFCPVQDLKIAIIALKLTSTTISNIYPQNIRTSNMPRLPSFEI